MHGVGGAVELNDRQTGDAPGRQRRRHLAHGRPPGRADDEPRSAAGPLRLPAARGGLRELADELDETGGGDGGDLLETMDLGGPLAHGHDVRPHAEFGPEARLETARPAGTGQFYPHHALTPGPGEQSRDR